MKMKQRNVRGMSQSWRRNYFDSFDWSLRMPKLYSTSGSWFLYISRWNRTRTRSVR